jgi:hypothetical protein
MLPPAPTVAGPVFVTATSARSFTVVVTRAPAFVPSLFVATGSAVVAAACATLVIGPVPGAVTVTVLCTLWPIGRLIAGQVTVPPDSVPLLEALWKIAPVGRTSLMTTPAAVLGPWLATVIV